VNNGVTRAARLLQKVVGAIEDGEIGDHTIAATASCVAEGSLPAVCAEFMAQRFILMTELSTWSHMSHRE